MLKTFDIGDGTVYRWYFQRIPDTSGLQYLFVFGDSDRTARAATFPMILLSFDYYTERMGSGSPTDTIGFRVLQQLTQQHSNDHTTRGWPGGWAAQLLADSAEITRRLEGVLTEDRLYQTGLFDSPVCPSNVDPHPWALRHIRAYLAQIPRDA